MSTHNAAARLLADLNACYLELHTAKEELFWATYMATSDDHDGFARAETAWKSFIADPANLARVRAALAELDAAGVGPTASTGLDWEAALDHRQPHPDFARDPARVRFGLEGWERLFAANLVESAAGREHMAGLVRLEGELFARRRDLVLEHVDETGRTVPASLPSLAVNLATNPAEAGRKSSFEAFRQLEHWVLDNGLAEIILARNRLARSLGYRNYFDYKVQKTEAMSPEQLFAILDDFEARTREACLRAHRELEARHGREATAPWNLRYHATGDVQRRLDPYMAVDQAVARWVASFGRLGISFRNATLQLDLLDRPGKYQNGFCHGPLPAHYGPDGSWVPGAINFTSLAQPGQVGSGLRALETLFHEGGHAAHFANGVRNSPCFSQEFPPSSMAFAETQSMFCDSLLDDADWLWRYARDREGQPPPDSLLRDRIAAGQPMEAFNARQILLVACFEWPLYCMDDAALSRGAATSQAILDLARATERRILGVESPRPLLAIPHLLNEESAASYHGYLLAQMAVFQVRDWFLRDSGFLTDNPAVGPALARVFWAPGNSVTLDQALRQLTGEGFSARHLAAACSRTVDQAWDAASRQLAAARARPQAAAADLEARIRVVHGDLVVADTGTGGGTAGLAEGFAAWVASLG